MPGSDTDGAEEVPVDWHIKIDDESRMNTNPKDTQGETFNEHRILDRERSDTPAAGGLKHPFRPIG